MHPEYCNFNVIHTKIINKIFYILFVFALNL